MASATQYWSVELRTVFPFEAPVVDIYSLALYDASNTLLTPTTVTVLGTPTSETDTANIFDGDPATFATRTWASQTSDLYENGWRLEFDSDVLPASCLVILALNAANPVGISESYWEVRISASTDGVIYSPVATQTPVVVTYGTPLGIPATSDSPVLPQPRTAIRNGTGGIFGIVAEDGVALPNRPVYLFDQETLQRIGSTTSDENGGYSFKGINTNSEFVVMSIDPSGPPFKNAQIYDRIKPINALSSLPPANPFLAFRTRKPSFSSYLGIKGFISNSGVPVDTLQVSAGNNCLPILCEDDFVPNGKTMINGLYEHYSFAPVEAKGGGEVVWLRSDAVAPELGESNQGIGRIFMLPRSRNNKIDGTAFYPENVSEFTFEMGVISPAVGEPDLVGLWGGEPSVSYSYPYRNNPHSKTFAIRFTESACEIYANFVGTSMQLMSSTGINPYQVYHLSVVYRSSDTLKVFLNGSLVDTVDISTTGFLKAHGYHHYEQNLLQNPDRNLPNTSGPTDIRGFVTFTLGANARSTTEMNRNPSGFGGAFGFMSLFTGALTDLEAQQLYSSFDDPTSVAVTPTVSGYGAVVEQDQPVAYLRLDDSGKDTASGPDIDVGYGITPFYVTDVANPATSDISFNQQNIISSTPSMGFLQIRSAVGLSNVNLNPAFTIEACIHIPTVNSTHGIYTETGWTTVTSWDPGEGDTCRSSIVFYVNSAGSLALRLNQLPISTNSNTNNLFWPTVSNYAPTIVTPSGTIQSGVDYHVALTVDPFAANVSFYVNGQLVSSIFSNAAKQFGDLYPYYRATRAYTSVGFVGCGTGETYYSSPIRTAGPFANDGIPSQANSALSYRIALYDSLRGYMSNFALYNYALTADRVAAHYDALT